MKFAYYKLQYHVGLLLIMASRLKWTKPAGHRVHRVNNRFRKCDCIFLKDRALSKINDKRVKVTSY